MGLGHVGDVLPGGDEHGRNPVRGMGAAVRGASLHRTDARDLPKTIQPLGLDTKKLLRHVPLQHELRDDTFAARLDHVHHGVLLVRIHVAGQKITRLQRVLRAYPLACIQRGLAGHVLACGVAGRVAKSRVQHVGNDVLLDLD